MSLLAGLRIVDLSGRLAGAYCTKLLADAGAEAIEVVRPGTTDAAVVKRGVRAIS